MPATINPLSPGTGEVIALAAANGIEITRPISEVRR